uniref:glucan endo-1,3-beta-D-glucosidase n=1 Tax=Blastobotrys adeninivorans TaxID=409370 RepID=A0A060T9K2_BLAAD
MDEYECNIDAEGIAKDIALLSQLTTRVRVYTTDCNLPDMVLDAIKSLNANVTLSLGLKMVRNLDVSIKQLSDFKRIITTYPDELIDSVWIGEEPISKGQLSEFELIGYLDFATGYLERTGKNIPVGTSETGSQWSPNLADHVSIIGVNINPFFGGLEANLSTLWTYDFLLEEFVNRLDIRDTTAQLMISEVGWPTEGGEIGDAKANEDQLQNFMDLWVCNNKDSQVGWYWHTAFDGPNDKDRQWENHWGLFSNDRLLKNITIPIC